MGPTSFEAISFLIHLGSSLVQSSVKANGRGIPQVYTTGVPIGLCVELVDRAYVLLFQKAVFRRLSHTIVRYTCYDESPRGSLVLWKCQEGFSSPHQNMSQHNVESALAQPECADTTAFELPAATKVAFHDSTYLLFDHIYFPHPPFLTVRQRCEIHWPPRVHGARWRPSSYILFSPEVCFHSISNRVSKTCSSMRGKAAENRVPGPALKWSDPFMSSALSDRSVVHT